MNPLLQFIQEMLPALSQILAVYGFGIAFFLFISQTETYNRAAWFSKIDGDKRAWLAIFNTSRRYLVKDQIYQGYLTIDAKYVVVNSKKEFGDIRCNVAESEDGTIKIDIDYMDRKSALVIELVSEEKIENIKLLGIIKDGRLLETSFKWDDRLHSKWFNTLVYIVIPAIVIAAILLALYGIGTKCGALWTYGIGMAGLPLGIYLYFRKHRRIFSKRFDEVKEYIKGQQTCPK